ncbi:MAG: ATP-binding protein [Hydrogenophaga sp.]|uniref:ATP-binding protein n=1 Tax=Hydrogenophaga sp. TaxID=1904254 RepID=UPI003D0FD147
MPTGTRNAWSSLTLEADRPSAPVRERGAMELELTYLENDQAMALSRGVVVPHLLVLVAFLWLMLPYAPPWASVLWTLGFALFLAVRVQMNAQYARRSVAERKAHAPHWRRVAVANAFVFGSLLGTAALFTFPDSPLEVRLLWTLILTLVVAAAPRLVIFPQFVALASPPLALLCVAWLNWGDEPGSTMAAALVMLAVPFLLLARHFARDQRNTFELHIRHEQLTADLARQNAAMELMARKKNLLLATASHDLRQPVHALGLLMEAVKQSKDAKTLRRRHDLATSNVAVISDMLTNLLDFARMEDDALPVKMQPTSLQGILDEVARMYEPVARQKALRLRVHPLKSPVQAHSDPYLLRRLLFNLVSNAIKYTHNGDIDIQVEQADQEITVHVKDTGVGIAPDRLEALFRDDATGDTESLPPDRGHGLGLGIVRRSADLMGHRVSVRSRLGQGSCFSVHLGQESVPIRASGASPPFSQQHQVVALVDDDAASLEGMVEMLRLWGYVPVAAASASQVQRMLNALELQPQLIVVDLHLGQEADGFEAISAFRNLPGASQLPAIMITGDLGHDPQRRCKAERIRLEYKPLRPARLREMLGETMLASQAAHPLATNSQREPPVI